MDTHKRIRWFMDERNWSEYRLAIESGLAQSTIANLFKRNTLPSIATLEAICKAFGITLSQFFCEGTLTELTCEQKELFDRWVTLSPKQKKLLMELIENMKC